MFKVRRLRMFVLEIKGALFKVIRNIFSVTMFSGSSYFLNLSDIAMVEGWDPL